MAIRTFKEGLLPPLKYRAVACNDTSFEKVRHFVLEEEPFTTRNEQKTFNPSQQSAKNTFFRNPAYKGSNKYQGNYSWNQRNESSNRNNQFNTPNHNRPTIQEAYQNQGNFSRNQPQGPDFTRKSTNIICHRCGKPGHLRNNCFVRLPNNNNFPNRQNQMNSPLREDPGNPNRNVPTSNIQLASNSLNSKNYQRDLHTNVVSCVSFILRIIK